MSWEFSIQGVGGEPIDPYEATLYIDNLQIQDSSTPPPEFVEYAVNLIDSSQAPNIMDETFDAIYETAAEAMATWEDDGFIPVEAPYSDTRAYMLTDGEKIYCGMLIADPDTGTLTTDSENDNLQKWMVDSWEIVFAANPGTVDGADYIKFAGDSAGFWDDISPDAEGGTDWDAPSFQTNAYIVTSSMRIPGRRSSRSPSPISSG